MNIKNQILPIAIALLPLLYLMFLWNDLPTEVPIHWNANNQIDSYGSKYILIFLPGLLPAFTYSIFLLSLRLDSIKQIDTNNIKVHRLNLGMTILMAILSIFILYSVYQHQLAHPNGITILIGVLFMVLGNYFQTIKRNQFIGIKTPPTLASDVVWKKTHKLGGYLWFIGGLLIIVLGLLLNPTTNLILFLIITAIIVIVPVVYSYRYKKEEKHSYH